MKGFLEFVFLTTVFFAGFSSIFAQQRFPYEEYDPRTLAELVSLNEEASKTMPKDKGQMIINGKPFYSAVRVKYVGTSKPLSKEETDFLKLWQTSLGYPEEILVLYENKYLFKECDQEYWIPVQKQLTTYFPKELKAGDMITLYLMYPGGLKLKSADSWNFIFLVNEFVKYKD